MKVFITSSKRTMVKLVLFLLVVASAIVSPTPGDKYLVVKLPANFPALTQGKYIVATQHDMTWPHVNVHACSSRVYIRGGVGNHCTNC